MRPEKDAPLEINFSQEIGDYYAELQVLKWNPDSYPNTLVDLDTTAKLSKASLSIELEAGSFYVLQLEQASYSFSDPVDFPVTVELK